MSPNFFFAHRNTMVTCAVCQYSRVFPLHLITPATAALMTFPPLISAASRWKIANLCPALPPIIAARTTMESPDTVIKTFTRCHHLLVKLFFFSSTVFFGSAICKLIVNSSSFGFSISVARLPAEQRLYIVRSVREYFINQGQVENLNKNGFEAAGRPWSRWFHRRRAQEDQRRAVDGRVRRRLPVNAGDR